MTSKMTEAEPRAVPKVSSSGRAFPREKLPKMIAKNVCSGNTHKGEGQGEGLGIP